jgi:hypothetical protein
MSVELIAISSFVIAILSAFGHFISKTNLKHLKMCGCCDSDCRDADANTEKKIEFNQRKIDSLFKKVDKLKAKRELSEPTTPSDDVIETML